jgi:hypothetical protein
MRDKYSKAMAYLKRRPGELHDAWINPEKHPAGALFSFVTPTGMPHLLAGGEPCGCLTMVAAGQYPACTDLLTQAIKMDDRLPRDMHSITLDSLPVFAEWQREIDIELGRA